METRSLKALSECILQENKAGNLRETSGFPEANLKETTPPTEEELLDMIRQTAAELSAMRNWSGFNDRLTPETKKQIRRIEDTVDLALAERDRESLVTALHGYRDIYLYSYRKELQSWERPPLKRR